MGNICSRGSNTDEAFAGSGHVVGAPAQSNPAPRAPIPASKSWKSTPGRTLGETSPPGEQGGAGQDEARSNAAIAAQKRAEAASSASKGKLGNKLAAQKAKTPTQTLAEASQTERAVRDADEQAVKRQWE